MEGEKVKEERERYVKKKNSFVCVIVIVMVMNWIEEVERFGVQFGCVLL